MTAQIPEVLKARPQWVLWKTESRGGKSATKIPYQPSGYHAESNNPQTWSDFQKVDSKSFLYDGIGFTFSAEDEFVGIDLDGCINQDGGEIAEWAIEVVERFNTYAEISPSKTGIKLFGIGRLPGEGKGRKTEIKADSFGKKNPAVEVYDRGRYFAVTGEHFPLSPLEVNQCQEALDWLLEKYFAKSIQPALPFVYSPLNRPTNVQERAERYVSRIPPAIEGQGGDRATFWVAHTLVVNFDLTPSEAWPIIWNWNCGCQPPWKEKDLRRKLENANKSTAPRGKLLVDKEQFPDVDLSQFQPVEPDFSLDTPANEIITSRHCPNGGSNPVCASEAKMLEIEINFPESEPPENEVAEPEYLRAMDAEEIDDFTRSTLTSFPQECLSPPGVLSEIIEYNLLTAQWPVPELALASAMCIVSTVTGRKIEDHVKTRTNIYAIGLAKSGFGKDHARGVAQNIFDAAGCMEMFYGSHDWHSPSAFVNEVETRPAVLFQTDEIGDILAAINNKGNAMLHKVATELKKMYSEANKLYTSPAYRDGTKNVRIYQPHPVVYGTATPSQFWSSLADNDVTGGLVGRMSAFEASGKPTFQEVEQRGVPFSVTAYIRWWADFTGHLGLNIECPKPVQVRYEKDAIDRHNARCRQVADRAFEQEDVASAIWMRSNEKVAKFAMIFASSRAGATVDFSITLKDVELAIKLVNWQTRRVLEQISVHVSGSKFEEQSKRVLQAIATWQREKKTPMPHAQLTQKTRSIHVRERTDVIKSLVESEDIIVSYGETKGRPACFYSLASRKGVKA